MRCAEMGAVHHPRDLLRRLKEVYRQNPQRLAANGERWGLSPGNLARGRLNRRRSRSQAPRRSESKRRRSHGRARRETARNRRERRKCSQ
eukprot:14371029-Alexandrium_andersonii.AAC.1